MAKTVNKVILVGNVGADPEVRRTASGTAVAHCSLATNRRTKDKKPRTDWHRVTFWGKAAEIVEQYVTRGSRLFVEGRIEYGSYDRDGLSIPTADIIAQEFVMLGGKEANNGD